MPKNDEKPNSAASSLKIVWIFNNTLIVSCVLVNIKVKKVITENEVFSIQNSVKCVSNSSKSVYYKKNSLRDI